MKSLDDLILNDSIFGPSDDDLIGTEVVKNGKKFIVTAEFLLVDGTCITTTIQSYHLGPVSMSVVKNLLLEQFWALKCAMRNEILIKLDKEYEKWVK